MLLFEAVHLLRSRSCEKQIVLTQLVQPLKLDDSLIHQIQTTRLFRFIKKKYRYFETWTKYQRRTANKTHTIQHKILTQCFKMHINVDELSVKNTRNDAVSIKLWLT